MRFTTVVIYIFISIFSFSMPTLSSPESRVGNWSCYEATCGIGNGDLDYFTPGMGRCECDKECIDYGDCCLDAQTYDEYKAKMNYGQYRCTEYRNRYYSIWIYTRVNCDATWSTSYAAELCHGSLTQSREDFKNPLMNIPVTSLLTNVTYGNYYCAICNNETMNNIENWNAILSCETDNEISDDYLKQNLTYKDNSWGVFIESFQGIPTFISCFFHTEPKENILNVTRRCTNTIESCSTNWKRIKEIDLCKAYKSTVYGPPPNEIQKEMKYSKQRESLYRNYYCGICNFLNPSNISCSPQTDHISYSMNIPRSLSFLFDFNNKNLECRNGEIWDPFHKKCQTIFCENGEQFLKDHCSKMATNNASSIVNTSSIDIKSNCNRIYLEPKEFSERENGSIFVPAIRRLFNSDEYLVKKDGGVLICIPRRYSSVMVYLTLVGLGLSCSCLVVHLILFLVIPDIRNLSGKNLSSFSLALLLAYVCFLIAAFQDTGVDDCVLTASFMYYFFLSSFFWMNVMAFDVWRTLKMATSQLRLNVGKQWRKFIFYSLYAWCLPLILLAFVVAVDLTQPSWIPQSFLPGLGRQKCWFGQKNAILLYFALPLGTIMLINVTLFILSVRMLVQASAQSSNNFRRSHSQKGQLKMYIRLALLMGLSWTSGIVAGYLQDERIWFVFIILNAFQGLYILLAFTCNGKVCRAFNKLRIFSQSCTNEKQSRELITQSKYSNTTHVSKLLSSPTHSLHSA